MVDGQGAEARNRTCPRPMTTWLMNQPTSKLNSTSPCSAPRLGAGAFHTSRSRLLSLGNNDPNENGARPETTWWSCSIAFLLSYVRK
jgi:hypothetical protein